MVQIADQKEDSEECFIWGSWNLQRIVHPYFNTFQLHVKCKRTPGNLLSLNSSKSISESKQFVKSVLKVDLIIFWTLKFCFHEATDFYENSYQCAETVVIKTNGPWESLGNQGIMQIRPIAYLFTNEYFKIWGKFIFLRWSTFLQVILKYSKFIFLPTLNPIKSIFLPNLFYCWILQKKKYEFT